MAIKFLSIRRPKTDFQYGVQSALHICSFLTCQLSQLWMKNIREKIAFILNMYRLFFLVIIP